jgi:hypothetical protein
MEYEAIGGDMMGEATIVLIIVSFCGNACISLFFTRLLNLYEISFNLI